MSGPSRSPRPGRRSIVAHLESHGCPTALTAAVRPIHAPSPHDSALNRLADKPSSRGWSVGFGVERIGLLAHGHPRIAAIVIALITVVSVYGLFHVTIDRNLRDMFRGESTAYATYLAAADEFVDPENQIFILIEGEAIGTPDVFPSLQELHLELQLLPDVGTVYSLFSLLGPPDANGRARPLVTDPEAGLDPLLIQAIRAHPILGASLVSADGTAMLISIGHAEAKAPLERHEILIEEINGVLSSILAGTGLRASVTGLAAARTEIVRLLKRDQVVLNGSGILVGFILSFLFFRSWAACLMTALPSALAGVTLIGWTGALGIPVTIVSNVVPVLVMVLGYADGMHLTSAWRRHRDRGLSPAKAERMALLEAGPPCMLTALTMAVAFLSMTISDVAMVRDFGWTGAVGTIVGTWIVLAGHALAGRALGRYWRQSATMSRTPLGWLAAPTAALTRWVTAAAWPIAISSVPLTIVCGILFLSVPPDHSVHQTLPPGSTAAQALTVIDAKLGGAFPIDIIVPMGEVAPLSAEGLARIRSVHEAVAAVEGTRSTFSIWSLASWLGVEGATDLAPVLALLEQLPDEARRRFLGPSGALVTVNISDLPTVQTIALVDRIETAALQAVPESIVTGATVVGAREATRTINNLNLSLGLAVIAGLVLIAIALRSIAIALVALIPNLLPDMATGSLLFFLGDGMQLTGVVGLTIAFGIAIDDTIHYLNTVVRLRVEGPVRDRLVAAAHEVGPVLIATTLVIVAGMFMTLTSGLTPVVTFGLIVVTSLVMAMFGDLVFLPAIMAGPARRWFDRVDKSAAPAAPTQPAEPAARGEGVHPVP